MSAILRRDFLLEVGTEEIPARMAHKASQDLKTLFTKELAGARLEAEGMEADVTPRRLVLRVSGLMECQPDVVESRRGPAVKIAFDDAGNPTKAAMGFARSVGVQAQELERKEVKGTEYLFATVEQAGESTATLLAQMLPRILGSLRFPKSMRWGTIKEPFVRPVHWLLALFGDEVIPFEYAQISSGNRTQGHRFMGQRGWLEVTTPADYPGVMKKNFVMFSPTERKESIEAGLAKKSKELELSILPDSGLLDTVTHLVEYPVVMAGAFDERFLEMPDEVLITAMRTHQKYFACEKDGGLANHFLFVSNTKPVDESVVVRGNERVLGARLSDAFFFYSEDRKKSLESFVEGLQGQTFLRGMGTMLDKTRRLENLAGELAEKLFPANAENARRAAMLCKADLSTLMVGEFPDLQGRMGQDYAELDKEPEAVSKAIFEHYLPRQAGDDLPESPEGMALSLADKIDSIAACHHLGLIPTATKDPYALRRAALGCVRIMAERSLALSLPELVGSGVKNLSAPPEKLEELVGIIVTFMVGRLRNWLAGDFPTEVVDACLEAGSDYPYDVLEKTRSVARLRDRSDYEDLVHPFKRVMNITKGQQVDGEFDPSIANEDAEKVLWSSFQDKRADIQGALDSRRYDDVLQKLLELKPAIDGYFDAVLVMCEDETEKANHLAMLSEISAFFLQFVDFTKILV